MNLSEGIERYIAQRKIEGFVFKTGEQSYRELVKRVGDIQMRALSTLDLARYLAYFDDFPEAWQIRFCLLERFIEYWIVRGEIAPLQMPPRRTKTPIRFLPYVFSRSELSAIFTTATSSQSRWSCAVDHRTLRTLAVIAYGTGASPGEVRRLERKDMRLRSKSLRVRNPRSKEIRIIPIGDTLCDVLATFSKWRFRVKGKDDRLFLTKDGSPISATHISHAFARLCKNAGVVRTDGLSVNPRFQDLRNTFAVHCVAAWVESGSDLNKMLPALAGYMGMGDLLATQRYLRRTPERFLGPLALLSPKKCKIHWRDNPAVMATLANLQGNKT
jgi:integrase/recombinase XerD